MPDRVANAIRTSAPYALSVFLTYVVSAAVGAAMAHSGSQYALSRRDAIVAGAAFDQSSIDYRAGHRTRAALADAAANVGLSALPQTIAGLTIILPYVTVAYQGWVGGVVSVDGDHVSRLRSLRGSAYYLGVLLLQFTAFSLCIGGGIRCGVVLYEQNREVGWRFWRYRLARSTLGDLLRVTGASIPLFLVASLFEFLSSWNA
ncbi:MAG: hypothetical protein KJZ47_05620 [Gemmatimonadales bacterium]|nr:hypothetical protein [Gemmatimonadales bacterium]